MKKRVFAAVALCVVVGFTGCKKKPVVTVPEPVKEVVKEVVKEPEVIKEEPKIEVPVRDLEAEIRKNLQTIKFEYDSYQLTAESKEFLSIAAKFLKIEGNISVKIEGNCDERGSTDYNMALGEKRAEAVRDYLTRAGVAASRIETISYGKENLLNVGCADDACHEANRRAEYKAKY